MMARRMVKKRTVMVKSRIPEKLHNILEDYRLSVMKAKGKYVGNAEAYSLFADKLSKRRRKKL